MLPSAHLHWLHDSVAVQMLRVETPSIMYAVRPNHLGTSQVAAAVLLWDALLMPQRRQSSFYGEVAARHPATAADTSGEATIMPPAAAVVVAPTVTPVHEVRVIL